MSISARRHSSLPIFLFIVICTAMLLFMPGPAASEDRQLVSGPYSLSLHGGALDDTGVIGADGRLDFLNPKLNVHVFGTYDLVDAGSGIGKVNAQRYGAGLALSHTYSRKANVFVGTAIMNELNEYFGQVYLGGKVKVSDTTLLSASYGFAVGPERQIGQQTRFLKGRAMDWGKVGAVYVRPSGFKTNLYSYLTDPGGENIAGLEGEVSYPFTDSITAGVNGSVDLTEKSNVNRDWKSLAFVTYAFGAQKGAPIDVALDKNSPISYPRIKRTTGTRRAAVSGTPLTVTPATATANGWLCGGNVPVVFTASGGAGPYTWSSSEGGTTNLYNITGTTADWIEMVHTFSGQFTVTITATDSSSPPRSGSAVLTVTNPCT